MVRLSSDAQITQTLRVSPGGFCCGCWQPPGDKSITHRCLLLAAIAEDTSIIAAPLLAEDTRATMAALQALGVTITQQDGQFRVQGLGLTGLQTPTQPLDLGNAGTGLRLLTGLLVGQGVRATLLGDASLARRPMQPLIDALQSLGCTVYSQAGRLPLCTATDLGAGHSGTVVLSNASAQVHSAVLLAACHWPGETIVYEPLPTRDHTFFALLRAGAKVARLKRPDIGYCVQGGRPLRGVQTTVPGDFSAAAFFIVAATVLPGSFLTIKNVLLNPRRTGLLSALQAMGAAIRITPAPRANIEDELVGEIVVQSSDLCGLALPREAIPDIIDELPILFIAAACAQGKSVFAGLAPLRDKESDRLSGMVNALRILGVSLSVLDDTLSITGGQALQGGIVDALGDHRLAMALSIAGTVAQAPVTVLNSQGISTSFPSFVAEANTLGLTIVTHDAQEYAHDVNRQ